MTAAKQKRSYEQIISELETVVTQLEAGSLPLADMLALYARGDALVKEAGVLLDGYEARLTELSLPKEPPEEEDGI